MSFLSPQAAAPQSGAASSPATPTPAQSAVHSTPPTEIMPSLLGLMFAHQNEDMAALLRVMGETVCKAMKQQSAQTDAKLKAHQHAQDQVWAAAYAQVIKAREAAVLLRNKRFEKFSLELLACCAEQKTGQTAAGGCC